ncbi:cytochrome o ubiquinol oxidase subunit III [Amantichitinum ursilacus]|uniref:Cytochrome bo(3) ubiquinol oxidase subunit 3 n=1 Tax=Amantichitinum ursilacus TaxID=857265 RepID=A0A0N1JRL5_9NEIS|nr:cytochrome o ubiquinol oxidase subunit III [Amantichitinum ursilacus]KPC50172.1 Cytochrome bo(3) ubiquinol oxidase subunit 3 [Amantichitinum ursilacus]
MTDAQISQMTPEGSEIPISERGPAPTRVVVSYGFWLFILSDIILFAALFAAYAVLSGQTAGGPSGHQLFDRGHVLIETACLLLSSFTCGMFSLAIDQRSARYTYVFGAITFALGLGFIGLELSEFTEMIAHGNGPQRSAFLSAFFALVGMHGTHVTLGLAWLLGMLAQVATLGFTPRVVGRLRCFSLFWHALDVVWIGVFTIVYLGAH